MKLILHLGYPKTGTTSLQEGVFNKLHDEEYINYIGVNKKGSNTEVVHAIRNHLFEDKPITLNPELFKEDKINVFSDEVLLRSPTFINRQYGISVNVSGYAQKLFKLFNTLTTDITIVIALRRQDEAIYSGYIQNTKYFDKIPAESNFSSFAFDDKETELRKEKFKIYFYQDIIKGFAEQFGPKKIKILFFEEFMKNPESYFKKWADLIDVNPDKLLQLSKKSHENKKIKVNGTYYRSKSGGGMIGKVLPGWVYAKIKDIAWLRLLWVRLNNKDIVKVEPLTKGQRQIILGSFEQSNTALLNQFPELNDYLVKFGYINKKVS